MENNQLPTTVIRTLNQDGFQKALETCSSLTDKVLVCLHVEDREYAQELCEAALRERLCHNEPAVVPEGNYVYVDIGDFHGSHVIRERLGEQTISLEGSYLHEPTDVEFGFSDYSLEERFQRIRDREPKGSTAKATYRRTRL